LNITMPHCDIEMPVTVRNKRTKEIIPNAKVQIQLVETTLGTAIKRTYENNQLIPDQETDDKGIAIFKITAIGKFDINVQAEGFLAQEKSKHPIVCDARYCDECSAELTVFLPEDWCTDAKIKVVVRDAKNNDALVGATLSVVQETLVANGGDEIFRELVGATGTHMVPIASKGTYVIEVTMAGYKTQTIKHEVDIEKGDCDAYAPIYSVVVPAIPCEGGVTVSLTWLQQPADLDLYSYKVGLAADNETRCLAYYCSGKDPCNCVSFMVDNKNGGLEGAETIEYCCKDELQYSHMLYVDDFSSTAVGGKLSLIDSGAKVVISGVDRSETIPINANASKGFRYWVAGCLVFTDTDEKWIFLNSDDFLHEKPHMAEPLYCNSLWVAGQKTFVGDWTITITVKDAVKNTPIPNATVTAKNGVYKVQGTTDTDGVVSLDVTVSGLYTATVKADGYVIGSRSAFVENSKVYTTQAIVGLSPTLDAGSVRLILNWNKEPKDMDLHTLQVDKTTGKKSCHTFWKYKNRCEASGVLLDIDNRNGGLEGLETITMSDVQDNFQNTYLIWVDDYGGGGSTLEESGSQVTITDGKSTQIVQMPAFTDKTPAGVQYWIVGCMAIVGESYNFVPMNEFAEQDPTVGTPKLCHDYFENNPPSPPPAPVFPPKKVFKVYPFDVMTNSFVSGVEGELTRETGKGKETVGELTLAGAKDTFLSAPISQNGVYTASLKQGRYSETAEMVVNCDVQKPNECDPSVGIPFLNWSMEKSVMSLTWGQNPADLDLIIVQENSAKSQRNCKKKTCTEVSYVASESGGNQLSGGEAATLSVATGTKFLVYVDIKDEVQRAQFKESGALVTFWYYNGGEKQIQKAQLDAALYNNERYWVVGCVGKKSEKPLTFSLTASTKHNKKQDADQLLIESPKFPTEPSKWRSKAKKATNQWIQIKFQEETCISGFRALSTWKYPDAMFKNWRFEASSDEGKTWTTVEGGEGVAEPWATDEQIKNRYKEDYNFGWRDFTFPDVTSQYFRLFMVDHYGYSPKSSYKYIIIDQLDMIPCPAIKVQEQTGGLFSKGFQNFFGKLPETELKTGYCTKNLV